MFVTLLLVLSGQAAFAQRAQAKLDSLRKVYAATTSAKERFGLLNTICIGLETVSDFKGMYDSTKTLQKLAVSLNNRELMAVAYGKRAAALRRLSRNKEALAVIDTGYSILPSKITPTEALSAVLAIRSLVHMSLGNADSCIFYGKRNIVVDSLLNSKELSNSYNSLATAYLSRGEYVTANSYFFRGLRMAERDNQNLTIGRCLINIGTVYFEMGDNVLARKYFEQCYNFRKKSGNKQGLAAVLGNLGGLEQKEKNYEKAIATYRESLGYSIPINYYPNMVTAYGNMAKAFQEIGQADSAITYASLCVQLCEKQNLVNNLALAYGSLGDLYKKTGRYSDAQTAYLKALEHGKQSISFTQSGILFNLAQTNEKLGEYEKALNYYRRYKQLDDSVLSEKNRKNAAKLELEFQTEKKDREIATQKLNLSRQNLDLKEKEQAILEQSFALKLQRQETEKQETQNALLQSRNENNLLAIRNQEEKMALQQLEAKSLTAKMELEKRNQDLENKRLKDELFRRNTIIGGGIFVFAIVGLVINSVRLRKRLELQNAILDQRKRLSADLHDDVGATLSSISIYTEAIKTKLKNNEPERVMELVNKIGENSRETISTLGDIVWNLNPINDSAERLFNRMESTATVLLSAQNTALDFTADPQLFSFDFSLEAKQNLYLIFKETINNAAKYAQASEVKVSIRKSSNALEMTISDNGKGFDTEKHSSGNGLKNIRQRTEALQGKATISSSGNGTQTDILIPLSGLGKP